MGGEAVEVEEEEEVEEEGEGEEEAGDSGWGSVWAWLCGSAAAASLLARCQWS